MASQPAKEQQSIYNFTVKILLCYYHFSSVSVIVRVSRSANSAAHELSQWETKTMYSGWVEPAQFPPTLDSAPMADSCMEIRLLRSTRNKERWLKWLPSAQIGSMDAKGNDVDLSTYKGKVLLIVNVASKCGMTNSNYTELNQLYEKYKEQGLEILVFPCNQFGEEEPGSNDQIVEFVCTRFKSEFPIFDKIEVNGENTAPVYKFLKSGKWGIIGDDIQWNFAKFLVDKDGQAVDRYYPTTSPLTIEHDIKKLLGVSE
uniref:Glutathione peroxidase n=1 Tax=Quercus lobata TaxID=97700 RepID=A0A7N2N7S0_QUELO